MSVKMYRVEVKRVMSMWDTIEVEAHCRADAEMMALDHDEVVQAICREEIKVWQDSTAS